MGAVFYDAAAGSGKTTHLVRLASECKAGNVLFTTFTDNNAEEIRRAFLREKGHVPGNIDILPWYTFLLRECIRPFQGAVFELSGEMISGIKLVGRASAPRTRKAVLHHYAFRKDDGTFCVYSDKLSELALLIDDESGGAVFDRLGRLYSMVCIDEAQDMAGYDLDLIAKLLEAVDDVRLAGDQRQATYHTANVQRNKKYRSLGFGRYIVDNGLGCEVDTETLRVCHRCPQEVVDLADELYPNLPQTDSAARHAGESSDAGVFLVRESDAARYAESLKAVALIHSRRAKVPDGISTLNMGAVKGRTFDKVLVFPTKDMLEWLLDHSVSLAETSRAKLYVAITRARHNVAFVVPDNFDPAAAPFGFWNAADN